jgi:hypothetical protein
VKEWTTGSESMNGSEDNGGFITKINICKG